MERGCWDRRWMLQAKGLMVEERQQAGVHEKCPPTQFRLFLPHSPQFPPLDGNFSICQRTNFLVAPRAQYSNRTEPTGAY